jgi:hypothetical protein
MGPWESVAAPAGAERGTGGNREGPRGMGKRVDLQHERPLGASRRTSTNVPSAIRRCPGHHIANAFPWFSLEPETCSGEGSPPQSPWLGAARRGRAVRSFRRVLDPFGP